jgi:hypothetical protein
VIASGGGAMLADIDGDGDVDVPSVGYVNPRVHGSMSSGVVTVRVLGRAGVANQHGVMVVLRRGGSSSSAAVVGSGVVGGGSSYGSGGYDVVLGVGGDVMSLDVGTGVSLVVDVVCVSGRRQMVTTVIRLLGEAVRVVVRDIPVISALELSRMSGVLVPGDVLRVRAYAAGNEVGLVACGVSVVNGVSVVGGVVDEHNGSYVFSYTVAVGDADATNGAIPVALRLCDARFPDAVSAVATASSLRPHTVAIDASPPVMRRCDGVTVDGNVTVYTTANVSLCVVCGSAATEPRGCSVVYFAMNVSDSTGAVTSSNGTVLLVGGPPQWTANTTVGPFSHGSLANVSVWGVDAVGNVGPRLVMRWEADLQSPVASVSTSPATLTSQTTAQFAFECSNIGCSYVYSVDGGARQSLGNDSSNSSVAWSTVSVVDALVVAAPSRVSRVVNS